MDRIAGKPKQPSLFDLSYITEDQFFEQAETKVIEALRHYTRGSGVFAERETLTTWLGLGNSEVVDFLVKIGMGREGHPQFDQGDLTGITTSLRSLDALGCGAYGLKHDDINSLSATLTPNKCDDFESTNEGNGDDSEGDTASATLFTASATLVSYLVGTAFGRWDVIKGAKAKSHEQLVCYEPFAPLHELVPWKEAKNYWEELLAGKYEWSSIGKQLREKGLVRE